MIIIIRERKREKKKEVEWIATRVYLKKERDSKESGYLAEGRR